VDTVSIFKALGLNVTEAKSSEYLHLTVSPPQGGPTLDVVKPERDSKFYVLGMAISVHQFHQQQLRSLKEEDRRRFLSKLRYALLKMGVDMAFTPPNEEVPQVIFVSRVVYEEESTPNDLLHAMYKVRNAGTIAIFMFADRFGTPQLGSTFM